jgi:nicotinamidase-related amidase
MIEVYGKQVFTELAELVDPAHTAVVVVDMQNDFLEPDGAFGRLGADLSMYRAMRPAVANLLANARLAGVLVVHLQNTALPDGRSDSPAQIRFNLRMHQGLRPDAAPLRYTGPGEPGREFVAEAAPRPGETVVPKFRSSGFWATNLDSLLRSNGIRTVVMCGCTTEGCVESTARDAMFNDYYVVIATDAVASDDPAQHAASMMLMANRFDLATTAELAGLWDPA